MKVVVSNDADNTNSPDFDETMAQLVRFYEESFETPTAIFVAEASIMSSIACSYYRAGIELSHRFTIAGYSNDIIKRFFVPTICTMSSRSNAWVSLPWSGY